MTTLEVLQCGPATSIQDSGRRGWARFGISSSGAADPRALAAANALAGNVAGTEAIEFVLVGGSFEVRGGVARMALAGARMPIRIDGQRVPDHTSFLLEPGQRLDIGAAKDGVYSILAVHGGLDIAPWLGSKSLHRRARIGGLDGRPLSSGSQIPLVLDSPVCTDQFAMKPLTLAADEPLRVVLGPQQSFVTETGLATFLESSFAISSEVDRMACRLSGPAIELARGFNIVSDGIVAGSVQIPGSGKPIVMLADRQTVGGYPKVATIVTADQRFLAQSRPGQQVRFRAVTIEEAEASARSNAAAIRDLTNHILLASQPLNRVADLLGINLAGHASNADDPTTWQC